MKDDDPNEGWANFKKTACFNYFLEKKIAAISH